MTRTRRPLSHPLADVFWRAVDSIAASLSPDTVRGYRATTRSFLRYLGAAHHEIRSLKQLRRDPHILGWLAHLRSQTPPIVLATHSNNVVRLRHILEELAWNEQMPNLAHLLRPDDCPRRERKTPRPLTAEHDQLLQQELVRRNDLASNVLLLLRHTGMRIGECIDLSFDCLHAGAPGEWAIHVPLGKMKTERLVPVDSFVCQLVQRLRALRSLDPTPADGLLLARPHGREMLLRGIRKSLHEITAAAGISAWIVPHQLRHTYATFMLRAGVSFPGIMKLLGHSSPDMTMRYLGIALPDLQREYQQARSQPRHLVPQPKPSNSSRADLPGLIQALRATQHVLEMFRRSLPDGAPRRHLSRLANRLTKILCEVQALEIPDK
jgi:site-specific recombinase XerD